MKKVSQREDKSLTRKTRRAYQRPTVTVARLSAAVRGNPGSSNDNRGELTQFGN
jgi:ribosomal protein S21